MKKAIIIGLLLALIPSGICLSERPISDPSMLENLVNATRKAENIMNEEKIHDLEIEIVSWKIRYHKALLENVKIYYHTLLVQDEKYVRINRALQKLNAEMDQLETKDKKEEEGK